ncbi:PREDICTED: histidinol dehydrogenase, chloroplastic-like [Erythranthe guttata]|uniref:histidinol dehydrogenase, chloroplastic-like n=1 Tax=Erythranthe guttata TaxID=4155 RepID=UPI00064E0523|nr:PREDICTED: histidinol dehydrogenase, chloroplastic-like [Erythranthe guttata]|eukprot:XP_012849897.1 PREDICTED: histidinol dehydrogenase, chloroplastic-like [Erythranthe guttata]
MTDKWHLLFLIVLRFHGYSYTRRFDKVELDTIVETVSDLPDPVLDPAVQEAFDVAYDNIYAFHDAQKPVEKIAENMEVSSAIFNCKIIPVCISSVGLYYPGGTAVLPSTALMLSVPAQIAGCKTIVLATPPAQDGSICKEVLYCAKKAGVTHILKAGGAQAISAMAWGSESCPKVEKIYGPGNQYNSSVFLGEWTPESVGDYASGTNHFLPTYGYARMYSGVSLDSFLKYITVQSLTEEGLRKLGPYVATMAEIEGLDAHKRAVTLRLKDIEARQLSNLR